MGVRRWLFNNAHPAAPATFPTAVAGLPTIDLGCGDKKRPGAVGLDMEKADGVDHVLDFEKQPLPFGDGKVGYVFTSHCLEHLRHAMPVMQEITRVAADGAGLEIWLPYGWHNDGMLVDHTIFWNEEQFMHMTAFFPEIWRERLGGSWEIKEIVFNIDSNTHRDLLRAGVDLAYALRFYKNVAREFGVLGQIRRAGAPRRMKPLWSFVHGRTDPVRRPVHPMGIASRYTQMARSLFL